MDYCAVLCDEAGNLSLQKFAEARLLAAYLKKLPATVRGFVFHGNQLHVTAGPWRFLVGEGIESIPLFEPPVPGKKDPSSRLGVAGSDTDLLDSDYSSLLKESIAEETKQTNADLATEDDDSDDEDLEDD